MCKRIRLKDRTRRRLRFALVAYSEAMAQTNPEESKKRLQEAVEVFKKLGAKRDLEKAQTKLSA